MPPSLSAETPPTPSSCGQTSVLHRLLSCLDLPTSHGRAGVLCSLHRAGEERARLWVDRLHDIGCTVLISAEVQEESTLRCCQQRHIRVVQVSLLTQRRGHSPPASSHTMSMAM